MAEKQQKAAIKKALPVPKGYAALRFEKQSIPRKFRDCILVYCDGEMRFERYCYGEAAGLTYGAFAQSIAPDGTITWAHNNPPAGLKQTMPNQLTGAEKDTLFFDDSPIQWLCAAKLKADEKNGYGFLKVLLSR
ncbi:MAG: hypothetical protein PHG02_03305 [Oscillospiraceae bacterium]|nr:hypothetical protein [Oscillospiraceae bacterium]